MRALQDRCVANEGVIRQFHKCQEIENKERDQNKEAIRTLNIELMGKLAQLEKETRRHEELEKTTTNLTIELAVICEQMDKAKADAMTAFRILQPFFDECGVYYGDGFEDFLKQVAAFYLNQDLSQVSIDDTVPSTLGGTDAISDEIDDSIHTVEGEVKDPDAEVVVQPALEGLAAPVVSSIANSPSTVDSPSIEDQSFFNAPLSFFFFLFFIFVSLFVRQWQMPLLLGFM